MRDEPGTAPEDILYIHIWNCFDPDSIDWEEREYSYQSRVVVNGTIRVQYWHTKEEAEMGALTMAKHLMDGRKTTN